MRQTTTGVSSKISSPTTRRSGRSKPLRSCSRSYGRSMLERSKAAISVCKKSYEAFRAISIAGRGTARAGGCPSGIGQSPCLRTSQSPMWPRPALSPSMTAIACALRPCWKLEDRTMRHLRFEAAHPAIAGSQALHNYRAEETLRMRSIAPMKMRGS
jgi:hypothetical protein